MRLVCSVEGLLRGEDGVGVEGARSGPVGLRHGCVMLAIVVAAMTKLEGTDQLERRRHCRHGAALNRESKRRTGSPHEKDRARKNNIEVINVLRGHTYKQLFCLLASWRSH